MKTKNSKRFGLFCLLMLLVVGAQGQTWKYPTVENGNTIVSRDAAGGIKNDALLTAAQKTFLMDQTTQPIYNEQSEYNKVSAKFQVASVDASTVCEGKYTYTKCKSYSESGAPAGSWRLPTQRELMLIWMFKSKLTNCGTITSTIEHFWSSTEYSFVTNYAWYVSFSNGQTFSSIKGAYLAVRCVRDL